MASALVQSKLAFNIVNVQSKRTYSLGNITSLSPTYRWSDSSRIHDNFKPKLIPITSQLDFANSDGEKEIFRDAIEARIERLYACKTMMDNLANLDEKEGTANLFAGCKDRRLYVGRFSFCEMRL